MHVFNDSNKYFILYFGPTTSIIFPIILLGPTLCLSALGTKTIISFFIMFSVHLKKYIYNYTCKNTMVRLT